MSVKPKRLDTSRFNTTSVMTIIEVQVNILMDWIPVLDDVNDCFDTQVLISKLNDFVETVKKQYK